MSDEDILHVQGQTIESWLELYRVACEIANDSRVDLVESERRLRLYNALETINPNWNGPD